MYENQVFFRHRARTLYQPLASSNNADLAKDWVRYGYMLLRYVESDFKEEQAQGNAPQAVQTTEAAQATRLAKQGLCQGSQPTQASGMQPRDRQIRGESVTYKDQ
ncbi:MAG: hypothetical protein H6728_01550 [Myxococcales bacterium]|nr:hypothetical protein [Myxococcales bacterium]